MAVRGRAVETLPKLIRSLRKDSLCSTRSKAQALPSLRRAFSLYDQINLIDNVPEDQLRFQGYTDTGFTVNGVNHEGSLLCVGNLLTSWGPNKFSEITPDSLSIFQIIRPIPALCLYFWCSCSVTCCYTKCNFWRTKEKILLLGCGRYIQPVHPELRHFIRSTGMKLEALDSRNVASTYNILNEEGRIVAAALLPYGVSS
ncbi:hypothetical protein REPUB_Repub03eG0242800 [Reevesia pubescens]